MPLLRLPSFRKKKDKDKPKLHKLKKGRMKPSRLAKVHINGIMQLDSTNSNLLHQKQWLAVAHDTLQTQHHLLCAVQPVLQQQQKSL